MDELAATPKTEVSTEAEAPLAPLNTVPATATGAHTRGTATRVERLRRVMRGRLLIAVAALTVAVPASAGAAVRTGSVQDPQGDVSSLNGEQVDDLRSVSVEYDDAAGTVHVTWTYWTDVTQTPHNSYDVAAIMLEDAQVSDGADVSVWIDKATYLEVQPTLRLWGVSGTMTGTWQLSDSGHTLTADFSHTALVGHDWQQAGAGAAGGDQSAAFWFDGYGPPTVPSTLPPYGGTGGAGSTDGSTSIPAPDDSHVGMTINGGARYTNNPKVTLSVVVPSWASTIRVANDGGFVNVNERPAATIVRWKLDESGAERLPKTVYVRFGSNPQTYTDDIILDQTNPTVTSARLVPSGAGAAHTASISSLTKHTYRIRIQAKDATSGVNKVRFAVSKGHPSVPQKFHRISRYNGKRAPKYVRVTDRAGNYSKWRSIRSPALTTRK